MKIAMLFRRRHAKARLNQELEFHLEQQVAENIANGMTPEDARFAALRLFGNPALLREEAQSSWSWHWLEKFWHDLRYGFRTLRRSPGFTLVAVAVMALGIGATASLFTIVRSVLLKPLPFQNPDKLVMVYEYFRNVSHGDGRNTVASGDYLDWREQTHGFQDMAAWRWSGCNLTGEHSELPEVVLAAAGSSNLFSVLGVQPVFGRTFSRDEDQPEGDHVVLLSWNLFQRRFGGDRSIVGKHVHIDSNPTTVIGVLPAWFTYPDQRVQLWVPYASAFEPGTLKKHDMHGSYVVARLRDDVSAQAATQQVSALQYQIHLANLSLPVAEDAVFVPMIDDVVRDAKTPILVLLGAVVCMLLIACLNVSNLLVARSAAKRREVAIRGALGGSRLTLVREQMTESLLICLMGGSLGLLLSFTSTQWLAQNWKGLPRADAIHIDGAVLGFSIALVFLSALMAGLLPAVSSTGKGLLDALQESSRSTGGASRRGLRKALLTAEIALSVVLLVAGGLLFKSFLHLRMSDLGCLTDNVLTMKYGLPESQYNKPEMVLEFHEALLERLRSLPGVLAAGLVSVPPGGGWGDDQVFTIPEHPSQGTLLEKQALLRTADPGYFSALQIPLLGGRFFTARERLERTPHVIVSRKFVDRFFPGESPLGKHVTMRWTAKEDTYEIVGVVGDTLYHVGQPIMATIYFPILSGVLERTTEATIVVHTSGNPLSMSVAVQKQVAALDPAQPVYDILTMEQIVGKTTASQSFSATLVLAFAMLSLLLAAAGLYGVLSYLVSQRVTEIGIRVALGAQRGQVLSMVLLDGLRPVFLGLLLGSCGAVAAGQLIKSMLYGTRPVDLTVFAAMVSSLLLTALAASMAPALRASRIEPAQALRAE
jgi:predicted permease